MLRPPPTLVGRLPLDAVVIGALGGVGDQVVGVDDTRLIRIDRRDRQIVHADEIAVEVGVEAVRLVDGAKLEIRCRLRLHDVVRRWSSWRKASGGVRNPWRIAHKRTSSA